MQVYTPIKEKENVLASVLGFSVVFMSVLCVDTSSSANFVFHHGEQHLVNNFNRLSQVTCGRRAGAFTCLLDEKGRYGAPDSFTTDLKPDFKVSSLGEVCSLLEANFKLMP